jgi:Flp pilus assembly protein TadG
MGSARRSQGRWRRREDGASLVEFALIMPLLFLLLIGTLTGGLTLSRQNAVKNAVREASRYGAVMPTFTSANLSVLRDQVVAAATGDLNAGVPGRVLCIALLDGDTWTYAVYKGSSTPSATATTAVGSLPASVRQDCRSSAVPAAPDGSTRRIWIRAARESNLEALLFSRTVTLDAQALSRWERTTP